jgi:hypothetical protein
MQILVPKFTLGYGDYIPDSPIFFLAGPVRGGGDWQHHMALLLSEAVPECVIAIPCRWDDTHSLGCHFVRSTRISFERQLNWERHYLKEAGIGFAPGCILFWLPPESEQDPHPGPEPYSMDTRGEIAEWRMRMKFQNARVVIGCPDPEAYHGLSQIHRNYSLELGYTFPIHRTMSDTVKAACTMMRKEPINRHL